MKQRSVGSVVVLAACLAPSAALGQATGQATGEASAEYRVTLDATWSPGSHPGAFPPDAHFSPFVGAVHDGETIAIRVRWPDVSGQAALFTNTHEPDAVALQFSTGDAPPLFGMGSSDHPTNIWHWQSLRLSDIAGALDLVDATPHVMSPTRLEAVAIDVPVYRRLDGVPELSRSGEALEATGVQAVEEAKREAGEVQVAPRWSDGEWAVVFWRTLEPGAGRDVALDPGASLRFACAIWNGAAGDRGPQKSISIWHELAIED